VNINDLPPSLGVLERLGFASPLCISSSCHYLEEDRFYPDAVAAIASAPPERRLYCFERGSDVLAAFHWDMSSDNNPRLAAVALREDGYGLVDSEDLQRIYAATVFGLGVIQYRDRLEGGSGAFVADDSLISGPMTDLQALGFRHEAGEWRLDSRSKTRLGALIALSRLRLSTRR
jgi:hypothetical protein